MVEVDLQFSEALSAKSIALIPKLSEISHCLTTALKLLVSIDELNIQKYACSAHSNKEVLELSIRIVDQEESKTLNGEYRAKHKATNVLSFSSDLPDYIPSNFIGDLVICENIVNKEANEQNKSFNAHFYHLCVHGLMHLLGFDHLTEQDAEVMETLEIKIMAALGINNPYAIS